MHRLTELDVNFNQAINRVNGFALDMAKEYGLEEDVIYHEFVARLATRFAINSSNIAVTIRRNLIERRERRAAKRAKTEQTG